MEKPFAPSCKRNQDFILPVLQEHFSQVREVLEIGSGTGQHAVHFAPHLPQLRWQTSDRASNLDGIRLWLEEANHPNTPHPLELDVLGPWPQRRFDAVFSANTLHILSWQEVEALFCGLDASLAPSGRLVIYGPFRIGGEHTSASNAAFDASLRAEVPHRGIRDKEAVDALARAIGLRLLEDRAMPANNRCLIWQRDYA